MPLSYHFIYNSACSERVSHFGHQINWTVLVIETNGTQRQVECWVNVCDEKRLTCTVEIRTVWWRIAYVVSSSLSSSSFRHVLCYRFVTAHWRAHCNWNCITMARNTHVTWTVSTCLAEYVTTAWMSLGLALILPHSPYIVSRTHTDARLGLMWFWSTYCRLVAARGLLPGTTRVVTRLEPHTCAFACDTMRCHAQSRNIRVRFFNPIKLKGMVHTGLVVSVSSLFFTDARTSD